MTLAYEIEKLIGIQSNVSYTVGEDFWTIEGGKHTITNIWCEHIDNNTWFHIEADIPGKIIMSIAFHAVSRVYRKV